ncbi:hypothetical protein A2Z33_00450 [Candidatus Gottesmanbacteria bacterium RBG_16_52_11]|uniref:methionyl-tRNA formyltransferase n=1 Tax=Candidatus Gottesmanbacteria bacterium RBG_16_52_11 TaxID=1798374 RepID=A0A1F5YMR9_9BACT|nr:MAG: hypothetical protein A2Z33_00450 [Candidatus Gottesmanbacteria bacterium RBG_16_52_11]
MNILFFGSTTDSVLVADALTKAGFVIGVVVTQPPKPKGRRGILSPTPVAVWADSQRIPVMSFAADMQKPWLYADEADAAQKMNAYKPDLLISASYGQKIPQSVLTASGHGGLNVHPSLLPRWRGADPVPWSILAGDQTVGVTVVTLSESFDRGAILCQEGLPMPPDALPDPLRTRLFGIGAELLVRILPDFLKGTSAAVSGQSDSRAPYARRFRREDGYIPWKAVQTALYPGGKYDPVSADAIPLGRELISKGLQPNPDLTRLIEVMVRALLPWPGTWTNVNVRNQKSPLPPLSAGYEGQAKVKTKLTKDPDIRLKILKAHIEEDRLQIDLAQLEGKKPAPYSQISGAYALF